MDTRNSDARKLALRQHRTIAIFLSLYCWQKNVNKIRVSRGDFERFLDLERFKEARIKWIKEDFKDFFPIITIERFTDSGMCNIIFSRGDSEPVTDFQFPWNRSEENSPFKNSDEVQISLLLSAAVQGLMSISDVPGMQR